MAVIPLRHACQHERYVPDVIDDYGNPVPQWQAGIEIPCNWYIGGSVAKLFVSSTVPVDHRDRFIVGVRRYEIDGQPEDYNHGPFSFTPGQFVVNLKLLDFTNTDGATHVG